MVSKLIVEFTFFHEVYEKSVESRRFLACFSAGRSLNFFAIIVVNFDCLALQIFFHLRNHLFLEEN